MTNETKSIVSKFLLVLAAILSVVIFMFLHYVNGDSVFITQVQNWDAVNWSQSILELIIVWVVFFAAKFIVLRQSPSAKYASGGNVAGSPVGPAPSAPNAPVNGFCTNCGTALGAGADFCTKCGARRA
ncbi:MAG: zinc ribbon domain-containing protein [Candidatus Sulfotelmatobacter sp.]